MPDPQNLPRIERESYMGDFQYWTSLWVIGLIIILFYLISVFGQAVFAFLSDRISVFAIWNSQVWLKMKVPLIIFCVIGLLIALMGYMRHGHSKKLQAAREYAQDQGWSFSDKAERKGRNPATGEDLRQPARRVVTFKCSGILRERINGSN